MWDNLIVELILKAGHWLRDMGKGTYKESYRKSDFFYPDTNGTAEKLHPPTTDSTIKTAMACMHAHTFNESSPISYAGKAGSKRLTAHHTQKSKSNQQYERINNSFHNGNLYRCNFTGDVSVRGEKRETPEILEKYLFNYLKENPGEHVLITGEIGCGKSTLISNVARQIQSDKAIASKHRPQNYIRKECVIINVNEKHGYDNLLRANNPGDCAFKFINETVIAQIKKQCDIECENWAQLYKKINKNIDLVLFFDDLDALYEMMHKQVYKEKQEKAQGADMIASSSDSYYKFLHRFMKETIQNNDISQNNVSCVFSCRNDLERLIQYFSQEQATGGKPIGDCFDLHIKVDKPALGFVMDVVKKRFQLAHSQGATNMNLDSINTETIEKIHNACHQGLRHTITVLRNTVPCIYQNEDGMERILGKGRELLPHFFLSERKNYTQANNGIVNIFLVNSDYRKENNHDNQYPQYMLEEHMHTYWLKYLILMYIYQLTKNPDEKGGYESISRSKIERAFCHSKNEKIRKYYKGIVNLALLSLSETEHGRLIRPRITGFEESGAIRLDGYFCAKRAKYLIEKDFFWGFEYLSVVCEDKWIELPNSVKIFMDFKNNYNFLTEPNKGKYISQYAQHFAAKVKNVYVFLDVLEISYEYEQKKCKGVFTELEKHGFQHPDFNRHKENIQKFIDDVIAYHKHSGNFTDEHIRMIEGASGEAHKFIKKNKKKTEKIFKKAYYTGFWKGKVVEDFAHN